MCDHVSWWINFFKDLCHQGIIDLTSQLEKECLWFCFGGLLQQHLNEMKEHWNTHCIRGSRHDTMKRRPDSLYYLPRWCTHLLPAIENEREFAKLHNIEREEKNTTWITSGTSWKPKTYKSDVIGEKHEDCFTN